MELSEIRQQIDQIDNEIIRLFLQRMHCSEEVARYKIQNGKAVFDPAREEAILQKVANLAGPDFAGAARLLYSSIMAVSRERQHQMMNSGEALRTLAATAPQALPTVQKVACPGVSGSFTHRAAMRLFPDSEPAFYTNFEDVFAAVADGTVDLGVVPVENSTAGSVNTVFDLILRHRFYIVGATSLHIHHHLCALPDSGPITDVVSHPQALAQCSNMIRQKGLTAHEYSNTAAAARMLSIEKPPHTAVLCPRRAAEEYGLTILEEDVQNVKNNCTRFIAISRTCCLPLHARKISLCFSIPHLPGSLNGVLSRFAMNGLNLTKVESRPIPGKTFEYDFYLDFTGNLHDAHTLNLIAALSDELPRFSFLGNYCEDEEMAET